MKVEKIGIVGIGYVGKAVYNLFHENIRPRFEVRMYDVIGKYNTKEEINECDMAVVCVPTPMNDDGSCDLSIIEETIAWLETPLILIKSTIPPGTTEYLKNKYKKRICFSPEYIGEGKYFVPFWKYAHPTEMKYHSFVVIGGDREDTVEMLEPFKRMMGPHVRYHSTDAKTAELTKYMENSWGATKVTFANEFYDIAQTFGVDYNELRELFLLDKRVEEMHTAVFKEARGFGGKCFPKDVNAIVHASKEAGYTPTLLEQVLKTNDKIRKSAGQSD